MTVNIKTTMKVYNSYHAKFPQGVQYYQTKTTTFVANINNIRKPCSFLVI